MCTLHPGQILVGEKSAADNAELFWDKPRLIKMTSDKDYLSLQMIKDETQPDCECNSDELSILIFIRNVYGKPSIFIIFESSVVCSSSPFVFILNFTDMIQFNRKA